MSDTPIPYERSLTSLEQRAKDIVQQITLEPGSIVLLRMAPGTAEAEARSVMRLLDAFLQQLECPIVNDPGLKAGA